MKKISLLLIIIILLIAIGWFFANKEKAVVDKTIGTYKNSSLGITFSYPKILTASTTDGVVTLHHDIAYENRGDCDMMGDEKIYPRLTDFRVTIQKMNKNVVDAMRTVSPYIPQENFVNNKVVVSPGFIDAFKTQGYEGYAIYEGAEGCGQTTYYFPIEEEKTLIIHKASIQILSGVIAEEKMNEVLAVPGVISREKSEEIFISILNSLKVQ